jgi:two-component system alkaline phosphatase synthesis response regulator PhoP
MGGHKPDGQTTGERIVFVDNDLLLLEAIGELLRSKGYEVHPARDGLEGLLAIRKLAPDYVLLDIVLPKIDGSRLCWLIRQDPRLRNTLIIGFSGLSPEQIRTFPELSADAYVAKGPLAIVANNILLAINYLKNKGGGSFEGGIFGYEGFRSRQMIGEMILARKTYETLMRSLELGVLQLDEEGRILLANTQACRILGKRENHLIAEKFSSVIPRQDRRAVEKALEELKKDSLLETRQVAFSLPGSVVLLRISPVIGDAQFKGVIVTLEPKRAEFPGPKK